jgi:hypothetical protein
MTSVEVRASLRWNLILVVIHALAILAVFLTPLNIWATGSLLITLALSLVLQLRAGAFKPLTLELNDRRSKVGAGGTARVQLSQASRVWGHLVLLCIADGAKLRNYVLLADSVTGLEEWALLRRHVRWLKSAQ